MTSSIFCPKHRTEPMARGACPSCTFNCAKCAHRHSSFLTETPPKESPTIAADVLAEEIVKISAAMKQLNASRLSQDAIVALIHDYSRVSKGTIKIVLNNLNTLEATWLKKKV